MTSPRYVTRERVQRTLDYADNYRTNRVVDDAIAAACRDIESWTHRYFYPVTSTRYPDPWRQIRGGILWLDSSTYEMCSISSLIVDGATWVEGTDFYLDPEDGPPFTSIRLFRNNTRAWPADDRTIRMAGEVGASNTTAPAGTLAASISTTSATSMTISDSSLIGVGDLVTVDSERVVVTAKSMSASLTTVSADMSAMQSGVTMSVVSGAALHEGEMVLVDSERMYVESIAGNVATVKRAVNGSALAAHLTGAAVYAPRICTIERAATGTSGATHLNGATLRINDAPAIVQEASLALTLNNIEQGKQAYARMTGAGENLAESTGRGVRQIVEDCVAAVGRVRIGATA